MLKNIKIKSCVIALLSSAFLAFGLYNVHSLSGVTEGGVLGMSLLLHHWFSISPSISTLIMNVCCYIFGWKLLGKDFIIYSIFCNVGFSISYSIFEKIGPLFSQLYSKPFLAAILGALFIGIGSGICIKIGGAISGDDALAMCIHHLTHIKIEWIYLLSDLIVLGLSITYIPIKRLIFSILTVIISGQVIGLIQRTNLTEKKQLKTNKSK